MNFFSRAGFLFWIARDDGGTTTWGVVNHNLIYITIEGDDLKTAKLKYGSEHISHAIIQHLVEAQSTLLTRFAFATETHLSDIAWRSFERLGNETLAAGGTFRVRRITEGKQRRNTGISIAYLSNTNIQ